MTEDDEPTALILTSPLTDEQRRQGVIDVAQIGTRASMGTARMGGPFEVQWTTVRYGKRDYLTAICISVTEDSESWSVSTAFLQSLRANALIERAIAANQSHAGHVSGANARRRYQRITPEVLRNVVEVVIGAVASGESSGKAVEQSFGCPKKTAERLIRRARDMFPDDMPPPRRGPRRHRT